MPFGMPDVEVPRMPCEKALWEPGHQESPYVELSRLAVCEYIYIHICICPYIYIYTLYIYTEV